MFFFSDSRYSTVEICVLDIALLALRIVFLMNEVRPLNGVEMISVASFERDMGICS